MWGSSQQIQSTNKKSKPCQYSIVYGSGPVVEETSLDAMVTSEAVEIDSTSNGNDKKWKRRIKGESTRIWFE